MVKRNPLYSGFKIPLIVLRKRIKGPAGKDLTDIAIPLQNLN
jgi:hypothetical protein